MSANRLINVFVVQWPLLPLLSNDVVSIMTNTEQEMRNQLGDLLLMKEEETVR